MNVYFEGGAFITASDGNGHVVIRCQSNLTDIRDDEPLPDFVARHGGNESTASYLSDCYRDRP